jgi:hypothetical protein
MKFSVEIVGKGATLERVRALYFTQAFDDAVARAANLVERKQVEHLVQPDGHERTRTRVVPNVGLPSTVQALLKGQAISYDEIVVYDPSTQRASFSIRSVAGKTVQVNGEIHFIEEPSGVRLHFSGEARIKIFGLGAMLERFLVKEVTERYARVQQVLQSFIDQTS